MLLLDLTKRPVMPPENTVILSGQSVIKTAVTVTHPAGEDAGPAARRRQIEWYQKQVEKEEARRVEKNLPSYDLDVCMISHFHDGAPCMQHTAHATSTCATPHASHAPNAPHASYSQCSLRMGTTRLGTQNRKPSRKRERSCGRPSSGRSSGTRR